MKTVYRAENVFDASLVRDLLDQAGILAFVNGTALQGGIGELPAAGLITVTVADEDVEAAHAVLDTFQAQQPQADAREADNPEALQPLLDPGI